MKHRKDETLPDLGHFALYNTSALFQRASFPHTSHSVSEHWPAGEHEFSDCTIEIPLWWASGQPLHCFRNFKKWQNTTVPVWWECSLSALHTDSSKLCETRHFAPSNEGYRNYSEVNIFNSTHAVNASSIKFASFTTCPCYDLALEEARDVVVATVTLRMSCMLSSK